MEYIHYDQVSFQTIDVGIKRLKIFKPFNFAILQLEDAHAQCFLAAQAKKEGMQTKRSGNII